MGLLGTLLTLGVLIVGMGYFFLEFSHTPSVSFSNESVPSMEQSVSQGIGAIDTARQISQQVTESSRQLADRINQEGVEVAKQGTEDVHREKMGDLSPLSREDSTAPLEEGSRNVDVVSRLVSFGHAESSGRKIDTIILHSSYNNQGGDEYSVDKVIDIWESYGVAPHYLIDRKGNIYQLVKDADTAYHAGVSEVPDGRTNVNRFSVGIEILNSLDDRYTDAQYESINDLLANLKEKYTIKYVLGHDDIAPGRKTDPWNFDWKRLK